MGDTYVLVRVLAVFDIATPGPDPRPPTPESRPPTSRSVCSTVGRYEYVSARMVVEIMHQGYQFRMLFVINLDIFPI